MARAQEFSGPALGQVGLGDLEAVMLFPHQAQAMGGGGVTRRAIDEQAMGGAGPAFDAPTPKYVSAF